MEALAAGDKGNVCFVVLDDKAVSMIATQYAHNMI